MREPSTERVKGSTQSFHVAAVPGIWGRWSMFYSINTRGTENVIWACRRQGVNRLIYTSSPSVIFDGQPQVDADESLPYPESFLCHYPHTKMLAERAVLQANTVPANSLAPNDESASHESLLTVAIRPHLIWGPRDNHLVPRLIQRAKSGRLRQVGDGANVVSMSYVENVAAAHLQAGDALKPGSAVCGQAYFINEPEPVNLWDWINELLSRAGLSPITKQVSHSAARRIGVVCEGLYGLLRLSAEPPMSRFLASQLSHTHTYRITKAQEDFDYSPAVSYDEAMHRVEPELLQHAARVLAVR